MFHGSIIRVRLILASKVVGRSPDRPTRSTEGLRSRAGGRTSVSDVVGSEDSTTTGFPGQFMISVPANSFRMVRLERLKE